MQTENPMGGCLAPIMFILALIGGVFFTVPGMSVVDAPATMVPATGDTFRSPNVIEAADIVAENGGFSLVVTGYLSDGCEFPTLTEIIPTDFGFEVELYRELSPAVMCPAVIVPFTQSVPLGTLEPGRSYTIVINDVFTIGYSFESR